ncbi:MAG: tetratricopeptide repeat protein [Pirellulales bacterium]
MPWQLLLTIGLLAADPTPARPKPPSDLPKIMRQADTSFQVGSWKSAATLYSKLVESNPTVGLYWYRLGESLRRTKRYEEAIDPLKKAEELGGFQHNPPRWAHRGEAAFSLSAAHAALGHPDQAVEWTRTSLKQGLRQIRKFHAEEFAELLKDPDFRKLVWAVDTQNLARDEGYRLDLQFALHELKRVHFSPFRATSEAQIDAMAAELASDIPRLTEDQIFVRMMAIVRQFGDSHTRITREQPQLPVSFFLFPEGLHVLAAAHEHADLVGAEVLKFGDKPAAEALALAETVVARENPMTTPWETAGALRSAVVLRGLGIVPAEGPISIEVEDVAGTTRRAELAVLPKRPQRGTFSFQVPGCQEPLPISLRNMTKTMWYELLPDGKTMYCQLNGIGHGEMSFMKFFEGLFVEVEKPEVERLILDLRWNGGGNTFLNPPLVNGIIRSAKFREPGNLFVVMGRNTFSAALNTLDDLERRTTAILVGEPTSSPPNFVGESVQVVLPYSRWPISISDLSWQTSFPMDYRVWIPPTLYAPPTAEAFRAHRDPALEAIMDFLAQDPQPTRSR